MMGFVRTIPYSAKGYSAVHEETKITKKNTTCTNLKDNKKRKMPTDDVLRIGFTLLLVSSLSCFKRHHLHKICRHYGSEQQDNTTNYIIYTE